MKKTIYWIVFIIITIVIFFFLLLLTDEVIRSFIVPEEYLFYEHSPLCSALLAPLLIIPVCFLTDYILYKIRAKLTSASEDLLGAVSLCKMLGRWNILPAVIWVVAIYVSFTSLAYVTEDQIVVITPLNPAGQAYSYADVEKIETGFGSKRISLRDYEVKGSFYYIITLDGKEIVFHQPTANMDIERYSEDTYLELEEFDGALTAFDIPKTSSAEGYEHCDFDQQYVDRFLRIINVNGW